MVTEFSQLFRLTSYLFVRYSGLSRANFSHATLGDEKGGANFENARIFKTSFIGIKGVRPYFSNSYLERSSFRNSKFLYGKFENSRFLMIDFSSATLHGT